MAQWRLLVVPYGSAAAVGGLAVHFLYRKHRAQRDLRSLMPSPHYTPDTLALRGLLKAADCNAATIVWPPNTAEEVIGQGVSGFGCA